MRPQFSKHVQADITLGEQHTARATITSELGKRWQSTFAVELQAGVPVIASLLIKPQGDTVPPGGLSARLVRTLKFSLPRKELRDFTESIQKLHPELEHLAAEGQAPHRKSDRGRTDLFYARIANQYCKLLESGKRNPARIIAKRRKEPPTRVRYMLWQARKRGLLDPVKKGLAGGELTPKCEAILKASMEARTKNRKEKTR